MSFLTSTRSLLLRGLVLMFVLVAASCSSGEATITTTPSADAGASDTAVATTTDDASTSATTTTGDTSTGETAAAAPSDENWAGPAWLTFPDGFTFTFGEEQSGTKDALVQGEIGDLTDEAALAHMRGVLTSNGYDLIRDTGFQIVGVNAANEFVSASVDASQPPLLSVYFLTERNAELQGFTQTSDVMNVDLDDGAPFDVPGTCGEGGKGFTSSDGTTTVSISGEYNDYSIFVSITTPDGVVWSGPDGSPSAIADVGFFMSSDVTSDTGDSALAFLNVDCVVGG